MVDSDGDKRGQHDLVGSTIREVRELIKLDHLAPGDRLPSEAELTQRLNVSRTVVREAYKSLAAMRQIDISPGRRPTVAHLDLSSISGVIEHGINTDQINVQQIYDVRRTIEVRTVALAALRRSDRDANLIRQHANTMLENYQKPLVVMESDIAFHEAIASASQNPVFAMIVHGFSQVTRQTWVIGWRTRSSDEAQLAMIKGHIDIAEAIQDGDQARAVMLMGQHFDSSVKALLEAGVL
jgi:GntR family transcriptional repressor for pyruvate dehydrogenase complex